MSGRRNPFDEIEELFERMSRNFDDMSRQFQQEGAPALGGGTASGMSLDVADSDGEYVVTADLPGYGKDDIDVTVEGRRLSIHAERDQETETGEPDQDRYIRRERRHERLSRTVTLPGEVAEGEASATHQNGVLTITLPKREAESSGNRIDVE